MRFMKGKLGAVLLMLAGAACSAMGQAAGSSASFPPLEQWKAAVISGNATLLKSMYSANPPAHVKTAAGEGGPETDTGFWTSLKARQIKLNLAKSDSPYAGVQQVVFEAEVHTGTGAADHVVYVNEAQLWQQENGQWRITAAQRSDASKLQQPLSTSKLIYDPNADAKAEIKQALAAAEKAHKRVLLIFGGNWCYDCHVLDLAFQRPELASVLKQNYEVVHVDVGEYDKNMDLGQQYQVPLKKGVPALAVLDSHGKLLYSQQSGEFEKARSLAPADLLAFLNKWKPTA
jgi:thioredoxin 1